jgi:hypothetical protein
LLEVGSGVGLDICGRHRRTRRHRDDLNGDPDSAGIS